MADSKLLEIIVTFSPEEKAAFPLFLRSPFFLKENYAEEMVRVYNFLLSAICDHTDRLPDKHLVHAAGFSEKTYSEARIDRALARLGQLAEQFLLVQFYQNEANESQRMLHLAGIFRERKMASRFGRNLQNMEKKAMENAKESSDNYLLLYQISKEEYVWRCILNKGAGDLAIPKVLQSLDLFYLTERAEILNNLLMQQKIVALEIPDLPQLLSGPLVDEKRFENQSPLLLVTKKIQELLLLRYPPKESFETLMSLIYEHEAALSAESIKGFYTYLRNLGSILITDGHSQLRHVLHEIQKDSLKRGYFYLHNQILPYPLLSIITIAILANKIEWAKQLLTSHKNRIMAGNETEDIYNLNMALCLFAEKQYEIALQHIAFPTAYPIYFIRAKQLELMIYYELRSELLPYKMDAFRKFFGRTAQKMVADKIMVSHINFINILLQLAQSKPKDSKRALQMIKRIEGKQILAERTWLLEKAKELG